MATDPTPTTAMLPPVTTGDDLPPIHWLTPEEGRAMFDAEAMATVGLTGDEFLRRYDTGELDCIIDGPDHMKLIDLIMLIPLVR